ncbi:hypothetical protein PanWU01x14_138690 [Parasponia andersonii]|uniref:Uncharacterized protein n=1 Tax=Parasponia andersonii TaxID=3476 RepID=A0A2P5CMS5_PARAD|nr:hypothetical protein PanWU01x14_138690 [Parasponia andersonii]
MCYSFAVHFWCDMSFSCQMNHQPVQLEPQVEVLTLAILCFFRRSNHYLSRTLPHLSSELACPVSVFTVKLRIPVGENYMSLISNGNQVKQPQVVQLKLLKTNINWNLNATL